MFNPASRSGFSMVELMIVIVIVGVAIAAGTPFLKGYLESRNLDSTIQALISQLDMARHRSVAESNPFRVLLNSPSANQYQIHDDDNGNGTIESNETVYGPYDLGTMSFGTISLGGDGELVYEPSGMLRAGQGGTISILDVDSRSMTLEIYASGIAAKQ